jgi:hypothetical protein
MRSLCRLALIGSGRYANIHDWILYTPGADASSTEFLVPQADSPNCQYIVPDTPPPSPPLHVRVSADRDDHCIAWYADFCSSHTEYL